MFPLQAEQDVEHLSINTGSQHKWLQSVFYLAEGNRNVAQGHIAQDHGEQESGGQSGHLVELLARLQWLDPDKARGICCLRQQLGHLISFTLLLRAS